MKTREKIIFPKMRPTMGHGILLCLSLKMVPGASQKTIMVMEQLAGMRLDPLTKMVAREVGILLLTGINHLQLGKHRRMVGAKEKELQTKLVVVIGINRNPLAMMVHQGGTRERKLGQMIRITTGASLETSAVDVDLGEDGVEVGVRNLEASMAEMIKEVGRAHGVVRMLEGPLGGLIAR